MSDGIKLNKEESDFSAAMAPLITVPRGIFNCTIGLQIFPFSPIENSWMACFHFGPLILGIQKITECVHGSTKG